jgi:alpha-1,6-mannosyltransferase
MTSGALVEQRIFSSAASTPIDIAGSALPAPLRPDSTLGILDISEYVGDFTGGVRTYLAEKARYVSRRPNLRQVLLIPGAHDAIVESDGVRCYRLRGPAIPFNPAYRFMLATRSTSRIVAHERPDIIEVGSAYFAPWLIFRARRQYRAPAVWFYHANLPRLVAPRQEREPAVRRALARVVSWYTRRIAAAVDCTIVASDFARRDLERIGVTRVAHVPLGVDLDLFHPARHSADPGARARLGLPEGPLALYVGRFATEKHAGRLAEEWGEVYRRTGVTLAMVGDGSLRPRIEALAGPGLVVLGYTRTRETVADLHAAADFYVSPCPYETFGLAALEALASGTPVLSADDGGVSEQVLRSRAGFLYRSGEPGALVRGVEQMMSADRAALGRCARSHAEREHSWDRVFDRIFAVYEGLLHR